MTEIQYVSRSPEDTQSIGRILGYLAQPGDIFLMTGELGTGKTCLTQGILFGLGSMEYARSPTFVLVSEYQARLQMYHVDLYRLGTPSDIFDLGLEEYLLGDGICVVEWAEKAPQLFGYDHFSINIRHSEDTVRTLTVKSRGPRYDRTLDAVKTA